MDFPGHLDKASMIKHLEDFDALHGGEDQSKDVQQLQLVVFGVHGRFKRGCHVFVFALEDGEESYPIPTGFIAAPATQRLGTN